MIRNLFAVVIAIFLIITVQAQAPQKMSYQAVIRNSNNDLVTNQAVGVRISILQSSETGSVVFSELYNPNPQTNANGLVTLEIGTGFAIKGSLESIMWGNNNYYIKTEIDPDGGTNYSITGTSQLLTVPYAFYAETTKNEFSGNYNDLTNKPTIDGSETKITAGSNITVSGKGTVESPYLISATGGTISGNNTGDMLYWNGNKWVIIPAGITGQVLTFLNGTPQWSQISGQIVSTPSVSTTNITNISTVSATGGGTVTSDGGYLVTSRGVCWNTTGTPIISDFTTSDGNGNGSFLSSITGLIPNTTYYLRAYATNSKGTGYGESVIFKTNLETTLATVTTSDVSVISETSASCGGTITSDGGTTVISRGICWNTSGNPTVLDNKTTDGTGTGDFASSLTGLTLNTNYYVKAYATTSMGTAYGEQKSFTTIMSLPILTTGAATNVTVFTATCNGSVTSDGGHSVTSRGLCWNTSENPTIANKTSSSGSGTGTFTYTLTDLIPNVTYYLRAYAMNSSGTAYGPQVSFRTKMGAVINSMTDSRDSHIYKTVTIGTQTWMAENLAYLPTTMPITTLSTTQQCYYVRNYESYGVLYNWTAAQTACPDGWHLPSDAEWTILENYLIANGYNYDWSTDNDGDRETNNKIAKSLATISGWNSNNITIGSVGYDKESNNKSNFSSIPGGYLNITNTNISYFTGNECYYWCNTEYDSSLSWTRGLGSRSIDIERLKFKKDRGLSVRCIKD